MWRKGGGGFSAIQQGLFGGFPEGFSVDSGSLFRVVGVEEGVEMAGSCRRPKVGGKHQGQSSQLDMHISVNDIITVPDKRLGNQYRKEPKTFFCEFPIDIRLE